MMTTDTLLANRYQIEELLSQKAGRRTFLAKDIQSQVPVIIKLLRFSDGFEWDDLKLFEREAATLKNLDHPGIPKYLDYFEVDEIDMPGFALVQSYIEASSLETLIRSGRKFSETEIIEIAEQLLELLVYLHQQCPPIIHRDIKPSNILLKNRSGHSIGEVYLVDFGSVQTAAKKEEGTITIVGSYGYIPLEQFGGQATAASDLYSLGMTLIYLLTGTHPAELPQVEGQVVFNANISKRLERWLKKMTHPHLDKRFDNAAFAQAALKSKDGSYGDFDRLKPSHTEIRLHRDQNRLQITWSETTPSIFLKLFTILFSFLFISTALFLPIGPWIIIVLFLILLFTWRFILLPSSSILVNYLLSICDKHFQLIIDDEYICRLKSRRSGLKPIKLSEHPRSQIEIVAYNPGYTFSECLDQNNNLIRGKTIVIQPKLYLYCGDFEYVFSNDFSKAELWWLAHELSGFLNLELQVIYPTPKVPPVQTCGGGC
jgi:serine/threonine protein kinase